MTDATASGSGLTVKYMLDFEGGERALFKPLRLNFERIGGKDVKDARHLEEPWGEVVASALARVLRLRNVPPAIIMEVPSARSRRRRPAPRSLGRSCRAAPLRVQDPGQAPRAVRVA